jgi:DNA-binding phage protein
MESISKDIDALIQKRGLSRYRVSKDIGVSQERLLRSLKENANPRWKTIKKVLDYLGYEVIPRPKKGGDTKKNNAVMAKTELKRGGKVK